MSRSSSRVSSAGSSYSSGTRAAYREISRTRSFLDGLGRLPRPQATIEDAQFLDYYSLKAQKLTLSDILSHCSLNSVEPLEEFPSKFSSSSSSSSVLFHKVDTEKTAPVSTSYSPKLHLNDKLLSAKQKQLRSLIHLYESEVQWLSLGSRLWFGPIRGRHVALLVDFSDSVCFGDIYSHYLSALHVAVEEQLVTMDRVYVFSIGTETSDPVIFDMRYNTSEQISAARKWFSNVKAQGSCNLLQGLKKVLKLMPSIDTVAIILSSRPNQKLSLIHDYLVQLLVGQENLPNFHIAAINLDENMQRTIVNMIEDLKGHYHQLSFSNEGEPLMEDTLINEINDELSNAHEVFRQLENVKNNIYDEFLLETLRQLSVVAEWPRDDTFTPPTSPMHSSVWSIPLSSTEWLKKRGIDSLGHNLYRFLAPDAYNQLTEYVSLIDKSAISSVYDLVMPQFLWSDGTYKYLHVDTARLSGYINDMKVHIELFRKRMHWLTSGSRMPFGNIEEKRVVIMIDTSIICGLHLTQLQQHLKILLHEQVSKLESFNLISVSDSYNQWSDHLEPPTRESLTDAWKWILHINPKGMCNLLESLRHVLESPEYDDDINLVDPIGLVVIVSSMPNQTEFFIDSYLEQKLAGRRLNLHIIFYQPEVPDRWAKVTLIKGAGRHGDTQAIEKCLKHLATDLGTYHHFNTGELVESTDYQILEKELERANFYLNSAQHILDDYKDYYCKRTVRTAQAEVDNVPERQRPCSAPPTYPRPTLASVARLNSTFAKLKEKKEDNMFRVARKPRKKGPFLTCHCFYLGKGLKKGLYYELMESGICSQCKKSLIPPGEESISTSEWLGKYGLRQLKLYSKGLFTSRKDGYKHVTTDGHVLELSISHKELGKLLKLFNAARSRYFGRLQWLLTDSRHIFGCLTGKKVVIMIDISSSMKEHEFILKEQLKNLIREQLAKKRIHSFNIIAFSTDVMSWETSLIPNTARNRSEAEEWIDRLRFGGCSNLDEAITFSLRQRGQAIYLISDGDTDHTSSYLMWQVRELKKTYPFGWSINSIAYQTTRNESLLLLQTLAKETKGRYHFYSSERQLDASTLLEKYKILYSEKQLGDDVKSLADEITLADYCIKQSLYHLGRYS